MQETKKARRKIGRGLLSVLLFLGGSALGTLALLYRWKVVPAGITWLYPWIEPLNIGLAVGCFCGVWFLWLQRSLALRITLTAVVFLAAFGLTRVLAGGGSAKVLHSPQRTHTFVLDRNEDGTALISRTYYKLWKKPRQELQNTGEGQVKYQWLEEDICAFTYLNEEGKTDQYIETMGDRGTGISYLDPLTAMDGTWGAEDGTTVTLEGGEVVVTTGGETQSFQSQDCQRFGTLALTLCQRGVPRWSLSMNQNCQLNDDDRITQGGTLSLCSISMEETTPLTLEARDERKPYGEISVEEDKTQSQEEQEQQIIRQMQLLVEKNQPSAESTDGIFYVEAEDPDESWNVRTALRTFMESGRVNGVDVRVQIDSIQRLAGDDRDSLYMVCFTELCISPGNQGGEPHGEKAQMTYRMRMMKTAGGYYAYIFHANEDGTWGLSQVDEESRNYAQQEAYHFFLSGQYDTTYMYINRRDPRQGLEAVYQENLQQTYPEAVPGEYDGMPCLDLRGDGKEYLLYDGISEDYENYCYQRVTLTEPQIQGSSRMTVEECYETPIIP